MIRKVKALGIALLAMTALGAVAAQAASAGEYTVPGAGATQVSHLTTDIITNHKFTTPSGSVTCTHVTFSGTQTGPNSTQLTIVPIYTGCTAFGFATAHVKMNECDYLFTEPTSVGANLWTIHPPHIQCPEGKAIEITPTAFGASVCTQKIAAQTPTNGHIMASNNALGGNEMDVVLETTIEGIHYTGNGGACGNGETHSDATYTGKDTVTGFSNPEHTTRIGVTIS